MKWRERAGRYKVGKVLSRGVEAEREDCGLLRSRDDWKDVEEMMMIERNSSHLFPPIDNQKKNYPNIQLLSHR